MIKTIGTFFAIVLAGMLAWWGYTYYEHRGNKTPFQQKAESARDTTKAAEILVQHTDTLWLPARTRYVTIRERNASNPAGKAVGEACDSLLAVQDKRLAARDTLTSALRRELNVWQNKPGPPRLQAYGEALYDVAHMVPMGRIGATLRILGPIHLSAAGQYAAPTAGKSNPDFRAMVGLRYDF
jgi:hypothetical protein